jgi:hypothetical protein
MNLNLFCPVYIEDKQIAIGSLRKRRENAFLGKSQDETSPECKHKDILGLRKMFGCFVSFVNDFLSTEKL